MKSFLKTKIIKYLAVFGLLIFLYLFGFLKPLERFIFSFSNPILTNLQVFSVKLNENYKQKVSQLDLKEENKKQKEEISKLRKENIDLKILENENKILRDYLGFLTRNKYNYIMARVISRGDFSSISKQDEFLIIDRGSDDGVYLGLALIDSEGNIIGKVASTKNKISKVFLINNQHCKIAVSILNNEQTNGMIEGNLGLSIKMDFIPQSVDLKIGDLVLSSGLEASIPRGLPIGKIFEINKENNELWQSAFVDPFADLNNISIVSVLVPSSKIDSFKN